MHRSILDQDNLIWAWTVTLRPDWVRLACLRLSRRWDASRRVRLTWCPIDTGIYSAI